MRTLAFALTLSLPFEGQALPPSIDDFSCTLSVVDAKGNPRALARGTLESLRRPDAGALPPFAPSGSEATTGRIAMNLHVPGRVEVGFEWNYEHAVAGGQGYHKGCMTHRTCDVRHTPPRCMAIACAVAGGPDEPFWGWTPVQLEGGVPGMAPDLSRPSVTVALEEGWQMRVRCRHLGTRRL